jgi:hypothetical protein
VLSAYRDAGNLRRRLASFRLHRCEEAGPRSGLRAHASARGAVARLQPSARVRARASVTRAQARVG